MLPFIPRTMNLIFLALNRAADKIIGCVGLNRALHGLTQSRTGENL